MTYDIKISLKLQFKLIIWINYLYLFGCFASCYIFDHTAKNKSIFFIGIKDKLNANICMMFVNLIYMQYVNLLLLFF